jgi:peptidoglycan/xylan/chitin deacetylase (PgdA/CDA1 family)
MDRPELSVTIDVEDWYHIPSVCSSPFSVYKTVEEFFEDWSSGYDYLTEPTMRVLNLLDEFRIEATFFVVGDVVKRYPGLVESIVERGHEIGCHGLHHACKIHPKKKTPLISTEAFKRRTEEAKRLLEKVSGQSVLGYRAPNALVAGWMLDNLEGLGFKYDSSVCVNSIYNKTDSSLKGVSSVPYYPQKRCLDAGEERDFVEFPWSYYDVGGFGIPTGGGPMLRFLSADLILRGLNQSLKRGHTVLYFHPIDISRSKFPGVGRGRPFYWTFKGEVVEKKIRHILTRLKHVEKIRLGDALGCVCEY